MKKASGVLGLLLGFILAACSPGDTVRPTVTLQSPTDGQTVNQANLTVQGTAQDNVGITRLTYQLNGGPEQQVNITPGQQVSFQFQVTLQEGQNTLAVNAYDQAGHKGTQTVRVTYSPGDTVRPTVTIQSPTDGQTVNQANLTVQGTAQDNVGITRLTYQLNGGAEQQLNLTPGPQVSFEFQVTLQEGQNTLTVNAYDQAGNKGTATVRVNYDPQAIHSLSGTVVSEYAGAPVSGTTLKLYREDQLVGTTQTDSEGRFTFSSLSPGRYRLEAQKPGMAGSVMQGILVPKMSTLTLIQRRAFDATASTTPPTLIVTDGAGGALDNRSFTNSIPFQVQVDATRDLVRPMRYIYVALGRTPGSAFITNSATWQRQIPSCATS